VVEGERADAARRQPAAQATGPFEHRDLGVRSRQFMRAGQSSHACAYHSKSHVIHRRGLAFSRSIG
jgi:hypothetical protein